jgi:hypothetical protein
MHPRRTRLRAFRAIDASKPPPDSPAQMFTRVLFLIALCFGLAAAPVRSLETCATVSGAPECHRCCADPNAACCAMSGRETAPTLPTKVAPTSSDAKQLVSPTLLLLGAAPLPALEPPALRRQHSARMPAQPLVFQTCIRLI